MKKSCSTCKNKVGIWCDGIPCHTSNYENWVLKKGKGEEQTCLNCIYEDLDSIDEPCFDCNGFLNWKSADEEKETLKVQFDYVVTHPTIWLTPEEVSVLQGKRCVVTIEEAEE